MGNWQAALRTVGRSPAASRGGLRQLCPNPGRPYLVRRITRRGAFSDGWRARVCSGHHVLLLRRVLIRAETAWPCPTPPGEGLGQFGAFGLSGVYALVRFVQF